MYRKILCFLLILGLSFGTVGCSKSTESGSSSTESEAAAEESCVAETEGLLELTLVHFDDNAEESVQTLRVGMTVAEYMEAMGASYDDLNFLQGEDGDPYDPKTDLLEAGMTRKIISSDDRIKYDGACIEDEVRITGIHYEICEPCGTAAENCLLYRIVRVLGEPSCGTLYEYITEDTGSFTWEDGDITILLGRDWVSINNYGLYEDE